MSLFSDLAKKLSVTVLATLRVRNVINDRNKISIERSNDKIIRENGLTARDTVISDTA
jgi:hypothetical protein